MKRQNHGLADKSVRSLVGMALQNKEDDDVYWECVGQLRLYRSEDQVVWVQRNFGSRNWRKRVLAVNIICQLGHPVKEGLPWQPLQLELAREVLGKALQDKQWLVVEAGLFGLGHRVFPEYLSEMLNFAQDPHEDVRYALAFSLGSYPLREAAQGLLELMLDTSSLVRDWATFGLGSQSEEDSQVIRDGLLAAAHDTEPEVRGEAMVGLARRGDERGKALVLKELGDGFHGSWAIDAAGHYADQQFLPVLERIRQNPEIADSAYFSSVLADAIQACSESSNGA
jgi:HEAT repeat protein